MFIFGFVCGAIAGAALSAWFGWGSKIKTVEDDLVAQAKNKAG
jgi:hypothetical protein